MDGVIVVDKPEGLTSHDVVNRMRRLANTRKVGHLGTLDPMATGVLPLVLGRATRLAQFFSSGEKTYDAQGPIWMGHRHLRPRGIAHVRARCAALHARGIGSGAGAVSRNHSANAAAIFGEEDRGNTRLSAGAQAHCRGIGTGGGAGIRARSAEISMEPRPASASAARPELICAASRTMSAAKLGCGAFLTALRRTVSGEFMRARRSP